MTRKCSTGACVAVSLGLALGYAGTASAATTVTLNAGSFGSTLVIDDATNDADAITVAESGGTITITDTGTGGITTADPDCAIVNAQTVTCPLDPADPAPPAQPTVPVNAVDLDLNNGTDSFNSQTFNASVQESDNSATGNKTVVSGPGSDGISTGVGDDIIDTGVSNDSVNSGEGADTVTTGADNDFVTAGAGNDLVDMGEGSDSFDEDAVANGADVLNGGPGRDTGNYGARTTPVTVIFNNLPDDGSAGEGDNVVVESINAGQAGDTVIGDDADNNIFGSSGDDLISGGGGTDILSPSLGADTVDAGAGPDTVFAHSDPDFGDSLNGGAGDDDQIGYCCDDDPITIAQDGQPNDGHTAEGDNLAAFENFVGGNGDDTITGDPSRNMFQGLDGNDTLIGLGGGDEFLAGVGDDIVVATDPASPASARAAHRATGEVGDDLNCDRGFDVVAVSAADLVATDCERQGAGVVSESAKVNSKGKAGVRVECPLEEGAPCVGSLVLLSNGKQVGQGSFQIANGQTKKATAKLSRKGRKTLAKSGGTLLVTAEARTNEPPGVSTRAETVQLLAAGG